MSKRRQPDEASAEQDWQPADPSPDAASTFAVAQDLLQAALDEIRSSGAGPDAEAPAQPPSARPAPAPKQPEPDPWAARTPAPRSAPSRRAQAAGAAAATTAAAAAKPAASTPAAPTAPAAPAKPAPRTTPGRARRRARAPGSTNPTPLDPSTEFDDLTDTLYQEPARETRRRRRPAAAGAAGATLAAGTAPEADLPPMPTADGAGPAAMEAAFEPAPPPAEPENLESEDLESEPAIVAAAGAPTVTAVRTAPDSRRRTKQIVAAVAVAAVFLAAVAIVVIPGGGSDKQAIRTAPGAQLTFDPITTPEGAQVTRVWKLQGSNGRDFVGLLEFSNPTSAPMETTFTEVIPKALAPSVDDITFQPQPTVVQADPVVRYSVVLPANGNFTARYEIPVAPDGADRARLETWAKELPPTATTLPPTTAAPEPPTAGSTTPATTPARTTATTGAPAPPPTNPPEPPPTNPPPSETGTTVVYVVSDNGGIGSFTVSSPFGTSVTGLGSANGYTVSPGQYSWTLEPLEGWNNVSADCHNRSGAPLSWSGSATTVAYDLQANATVICTFHVHKN
ncbi:MAG: hypothetical protein WDA60_01690 [Acidimicrobiia bacterium]|jgi:hypothetical protein